MDLNDFDEVPCIEFEPPSELAHSEQLIRQFKESLLKTTINALINKNGPVWWDSNKDSIIFQIHKHEPYFSCEIHWSVSASFEKLFDIEFINNVVNFILYSQND